MAKIVTFHSFRRGTGKSNLVANVAVQLSASGLRVGVVDTNLQSPSAHILFNLKGENISYNLNDYLWKSCALEQAVYDVTPRQDPFSAGKIFLIPACPTISCMTRILREGFDISLLNSIFSQFSNLYNLDVLLIDSQAGINQETVVSLAIADALVIIMRIDKQDFDGTAVILSLAERLELERVLLVVNNLPFAFDPETVRQEIESVYARTVNAILPYSDELMALASSDIFTIRYPAHPLSHAIRQLALQVIE